MAVVIKKKELVLKESHGTVSTKSGKGLEKVEHFNGLTAQVFDKPNCNVGYKMGYTKNLGNYESMRIDITVNVPCEYEYLEDGFEFAKEWVDNKMNKTVEEVESEIE